MQGSSRIGQSRIGAGTTIHGTVSGSGDLEVAGFVHGSISVDGDVAVEDGGRVKAAIDGRSISVRGAVAGDLRATEGIVLDAGARVVGDLSAPSVGIRPGGLVKGHVSTTGASATPARRSTSRKKQEEPRAVDSDEVPDSDRPAKPARRGGTKAAPAPRMPSLTKKMGSTRGNTTAVKGARSAKAPPAAATRAAATRPAATRARKAAPPPVVPSLKKGAKGSVRRKAR